MAFMVVAKNALELAGMSVALDTNYAEDGMSHHILEKVLQREGRVLIGEPGGAIPGFDPEKDILVGLRLGLSQADQVDPLDVFHIGLFIGNDKNLDKAIEDTIHQCIDLTSRTHSYRLKKMLTFGWVVSQDADSKEIFLARNFIGEAADINRQMS